MDYLIEQCNNIESFNEFITNNVPLISNEIKARKGDNK